MLLVGVLRFSKNVFFLGFSLLLFRCFLVLYIWKFISQWVGLVFFLVYITGVIVIFVFFCRFSRNVGGLVYSPSYSLIFFVFLRCNSLRVNLSKGLKEVREIRKFYFMPEIFQIGFLGIWLIFILWRCLKIVNVLGGTLR